MMNYAFVACASIFVSLTGCGSSEHVHGSESVQVESNQYQSDVPYWVPLIDQCMAKGGERIACIESLPSEVLTDLEQWERNRNRGALIKTRNADFGVSSAK